MSDLISRVEDKISINKYLYFDKSFGRFALTGEAFKIIYNQKQIICSYSGADEWCNHFVCELIDLYSGSSVYNYALGTIKHETEIPEIFKQHKDAVFRWVEKSMKEEWGIKAFSMFEKIIDDLPVSE